MLKANNNNIFFSITVIWQVLPLLFSCWFTQQNREQNTFICFFWIFFSSLNIFALNTYEVFFLFPVLLFYKAHCSCWTEWYGQRCEMCKSNKKLSFQLNETSDRLHDGGAFSWRWKENCFRSYSRSDFMIKLEPFVRKANRVVHSAFVELMMEAPSLRV